MTKLSEADGLRPVQHEIHQILKKNKQLVIIVIVTLVLIILYLSLLAYGGYMIYKSVPMIIDTVTTTVNKFEDAISKIQSMPAITPP
jgi:predicted PurR-regulated permease PerM